MVFEEYPIGGSGPTLKIENSKFTYPHAIQEQGNHLDGKL